MAQKHAMGHGYKLKRTPHDELWEAVHVQPPGPKWASHLGILDRWWTYFGNRAVTAEQAVRFIRGHIRSLDPDGDTIQVVYFDQAVELREAFFRVFCHGYPKADRLHEWLLTVEDQPVAGLMFQRMPLWQVVSYPEKIARAKDRARRLQRLPTIRNKHRIG